MIPVGDGVQLVSDPANYSGATAIHRLPTMQSSSVPQLPNGAFRASHGPGNRLSPSVLQLPSGAFRASDNAFGQLLATKQRESPTPDVRGAAVLLGGMNKESKEANTARRDTGTAEREAKEAPKAIDKKNSGSSADIRLVKRASRPKISATRTSPRKRLHQLVPKFHCPSTTGQKKKKRLKTA